MFSAVSRWFRRPRDTSGYVYYARIKVPQGTFYQLGYTSEKSLVDCMRIARLGDEKLIDREFLFTFCNNARDIEQTLLKHFGRHRVSGKFKSDLQIPLAGNGQSELFAHDILGLDSEICRLSDEDMQEAGMGYLLIIIGLILIPFTLGLSLLFIIGGLGGGRKIWNYGFIN